MKELKARKQDLGDEDLDRAAQKENELYSKNRDIDGEVEEKIRQAQWFDQERMWIHRDKKLGYPHPHMHCKPVKKKESYW